MYFDSFDYVIILQGSDWFQYLFSIHVVQWKCIEFVAWKRGDSKILRQFKQHARSDLHTQTQYNRSLPNLWSRDLERSSFAPDCLWSFERGWPGHRRGRYKSPACVYVQAKLKGARWRICALICLFYPRCSCLLTRSRRGRECAPTHPSTPLTPILARKFLTLKAVTSYTVSQGGYG